jgi:hypothetical protein
MMEALVKELLEAHIAETGTRNLLQLNELKVARGDTGRTREDGKKFDGFNQALEGKGAYR